MKTLIENINHLNAGINEYENSGYQVCKKNEAIKTLSKEIGVPTIISKFIVNTKLGRKIAYISLKKEIKNTIKEVKNNLK